MPKPKGGRGHAAPYLTRQVRVPEPIIYQAHILIERYQNHIAEGKDPINVPQLLDLNAASTEKLKSENTQLQQQIVQLRKQINKENKQKSKASDILKDALGLKANAGGAIKREIERALALLG